MPTPSDCYFPDHAVYGQASVCEPVVGEEGLGYTCAEL